MRSPQLRCVLFPSMYLPHLLVLPATFGLQCLLPPYPYFRAFYAVPVRQVRGLLTASFRFHLAMDTLAVRLCASSLPTRTRDFHPLENAHAGQTKQVPNKSLFETCLIGLHRLLNRIDGNLFLVPSFSFKLHSSIDQGKQCIVLANADVGSRVDPGPSLAI